MFFALRLPAIVIFACGRSLTCHASISVIRLSPRSAFKTTTRILLVAMTGKLAYLYSNPGESLRAAQALCDIHQWPFEWEKSNVAKTAARVTRLS